MLPECPEDLRYLLPYLQRASELKAREPVIAYYCGFYAARLALSKGYPKNKENEAFLNALFTELETEKAELQDEPALQDHEQAKALIMQFAMRIFLAADNEDRAGQATKKTGRLFLVASQFLEILKNFGDISEEIEERIKYAKWKAADIVRSLNEGKQPQAGPPNQVDNTENSNNVKDTLSILNQPSSPPPTIVLPPLNQPISPPIASPIQSPTPSCSSSEKAIIAPVSPVLDPLALSVAEKYARYAVSAIQFEDVPTAIQNLELCLDTLGRITSFRR